MISVFSVLGEISTHAPLAGRDKVFGDSSGQPVEFQPTRPLRGATVSDFPTMLSTSFQPTRPLRGATNYNAALLELDKHFNPRAPCGARPPLCSHSKSNTRISTHAPLAGRDDRGRGRVKFFIIFQPTRPLRGATASALGRAIVPAFQPTRPLRGATHRAYTDRDAQ